jgi:hypothetical protein
MKGMWIRNGGTEDSVESAQYRQVVLVAKWRSSREEVRVEGGFVRVSQRTSAPLQLFYRVLTHGYCVWWHLLQMANASTSGFNKIIRSKEKETFTSVIACCDDIFITVSSSLARVTVAARQATVKITCANSRSVHWLSCWRIEMPPLSLRVSN